MPASTTNPTLGKDGNNSGSTSSTSKDAVKLPPFKLGKRSSKKKTALEVLQGRIACRYRGRPTFRSKGLYQHQKSAAPASSAMKEVADIPSGNKSSGSRPHSEATSVARVPNRTTHINAIHPTKQGASLHQGSSTAIRQEKQGNQARTQVPNSKSASFKASSAEESVLSDSRNASPDPERPRHIRRAEAVAREEEELVAMLEAEKIKRAAEVMILILSCISTSLLINTV